MEANAELSDVEAVNLAIQELPETKRRVIASRTQLKWYSLDIPKRVGSETPPAIHLGEFDRANSILQLIKAVDRLEAKLERLAGLVERLYEPKAIEAQPKHVDVPKLMPSIEMPKITEVKPTKYKIGILGLHKYQFDIVQQKAGERANLVFMEKRLNVKTMPQLDYAILPKFISHAHQRQLIAVLGKDRVIMPKSGGIDETVKSIYDVASRQRSGI